ncbi:MAG: hypothetical protein KatS3mg103_0459 [Phycisphaerales bacterium]|nr:MAG: hypothetical protein KatS3mg103_0459 [Phycisphaerales bacterium]
MHELAGPVRPPASDGPLDTSQRIESIDVLRGVAVLGIFAMNLPIFALPGVAFFNPPAAGGFQGADYLAWLLGHTLLDMKMMAIFSMLFGAGVVLFAQRLEATGRRPGPVHARRMLWLLAIGMLHAYLLWFGDILVAYALVGLAIYPLRRWPPRRLVLLACAVLPVGMVLSGAQQAMFEAMRSATHGELAEAWREVAPMFEPTPESLAQEREKVLGGFFQRVRAHAPDVVMMQTWVFAVFIFWRVCGLMLLGMALGKLGVFSARRSPGFYRVMLLAGASIGGALVLVGVALNHALGFDPVAYFGVVGWFNYAGSVGVALAWVAAVMLLCQSRALPWLRRALAATGRMALTNYLAQSVFAAAVFYGWGLGLFGRFSRAELLAFVLAVWIVQPMLSVLWLARFRYGPMEWLWRCLTYARLEPIARVRQA